MHKTLFLSLFALTLFFGCTKKKKDTSPYASSEYFTCLVNGEEWVASTPNNPNGPAAVEAHYDPDYDQLNIFATKKDKNAGPNVYESFTLRIQNLGTSQPSIKIGNGDLVAFDSFLPVACGRYYYDPLYTCTCSIESLDLGNRKVKGSFSLNIRNPDCTDSIVTITNGQFSASL